MPWYGWLIVGLVVGGGAIFWTLCMVRIAATSAEPPGPLAELPGTERADRAHARLGSPHLFD